MPRPFIPLTLEQFAERLRTFHFTRVVNAVHMHHTFRPRQVDYQGLPTIEGMFKFHTGANGWSDIAQHLSIAPDGTIWTGRDWNNTPASATGFNKGVFMFETIGDFDAGKERLEGAQLRSVIGVIAWVQHKLGLPVESLHFHREFTDQKTCPGTGVNKADIHARVRVARAQIEAAPRTVAIGVVGSRSFDRAIPASRGFGDEESFEAVGTILAATPIDVDEGEVDCGAGAGAGVGAGGESRALGDRSTARGESFSADDLTELRKHVVNLRQGKFSGGGIFETTAADVRAIFAEHLPPKLAEAKDQGRKLRIVVFAHGGLVDEESGLAMAKAVIPWWLANKVYPIYFVWETGLFETLTQLMKGERAFETREFDPFDITDRPIEDLVRKIGGGKIWDGMKQSARRSVEADGGALIVAQQLAKFWDANRNDVEVHAVGHSAGSIFHSHFAPALLDLTTKGQTIATMNFLAPAIRVQEFKDLLIDRIGNGVDSLTMFTMRKDLERKDNCASLYRKSLLYLIHFALEAERGDAILGLDESIRDDEQLMALFGIGGTPGQHEVIFSKTDATSGRSATRARSHGGFDNDVATMESVVRRVLNASDTDEIVPFPSDTAREFSSATVLGGAADLQPDVAPDAAPAAAPSAPSRRPSATQPASKLGRALCVGINAYPNGQSLSGCVNDAKNWAAAFQSLGFDVELVTDAQATKENLVNKLRALVASAGPGDAIAFQYAGHGTFFKDITGPQRDEDDGNDEALVPVDFPRGTFILDDELFEIFSHLKDGASLTCFFDCCHSGSMSREAVFNLVETAQRNPDDVLRPRFMAPTQEMIDEYRRQREGAREFGQHSRSLRSSEDLKAVVFSACKDTEVAMERGGHGVFTSLVASTLKTAFDGGTTNDVFQQQIQKAFGNNKSQHPVLDCASRARGIPLFRLLGGSGREREVPIDASSDANGDGVKVPPGGGPTSSRERTKRPSR
jgi:hypothetical protein